MRLHIKTVDSIGFPHSAAQQAKLEIYLQIELRSSENCACGIGQQHSKLPNRSIDPYVSIHNIRAVDRSIDLSIHNIRAVDRSIDRSADS
jgi:hypothetical protein